jgi:PAS domain S-box-containing protein
MNQKSADLVNVTELNASNIQQLVDAMPVGAMVADEAGKIIQANTELEHVLGYKQGELLGSDIKNLLPEQFRSNHHVLMSQYLKSPQKRQMGVGRELYALRLDGTEIPIEIGLNPINVNGELRVLMTLVDITSRLQAASMFKRSINAAPHGILVVDESGKIKFVNPTLCCYFGYAERELINQTMEMLLPNRHRGDHHKLRASYCSDPDVRMMGVGRDLTALHKDGREFPVEIGLSPFEDGSNERMVLVTLMDITERKRMEMSLKEINKNLEEFTYVASHDLRSPLRGISDLLEWIKEDLGENIAPAILNNVDRISVRIHKMETLIENLLAYARAGKETTEIEQVNVDDLINGIFELTQLPENFKLEKDITINTLETTKTPLETILRNLISNAIKHHNADSGVIKISCHSEKNMCHFSICDDGPGIPEASHDRIFRLFQTVTSSAKDSSGIGLSVSRRLAETHGGRINVENNKNKPGATFNVWWPRFIRMDNHD